MKDDDLIRNINPFGLRMQPALRAKVEEAASQNHRSLNAEIVARLEESFQAHSSPALDRMLAILGLQRIYRVRACVSTSDALDDLLFVINNASPIKAVWLAVREGEHNHSALTVVIEIGDFILLADETLLTIERRPRELEIQALIAALDRRGMLEGATQFSLQRIIKTADKSPETAFDTIAYNDFAMLTAKSLPQFLNLFLEAPREFSQECLNDYLANG
ncbi:Arc family DNA-binding protein [Pseudomonas aeruginosa]